MKTKRITYLAAALALTVAGSSCEHDEIYEPLEFSVQLAPTNTYKTGDPVVFNFSGNADYITVWNGDTGHEYKYRDRTSVAFEDIEQCTLEIEISQQYSKADIRNLNMLVGNQFQGLNGQDAEADRQIVEAIEASRQGNEYPGWKTLEYEDNNANTFKTETYDITEYADNFTFGVHLFQNEEDLNQTMKTYRINPKIRVKIKGYDTQEYSGLSMGERFITYSLADIHADNPYIHNISGNGNLRIQGLPGDYNTAAVIVYQGFNAGAAGMPSPVRQFGFMRPMSLNTITPDTGQSIKGVADDVKSYSYTYDKPGTYTVTFLVGNGNYQGESGIQTYEMKVTIIDPIE